VRRNRKGPGDLGFGQGREKVLPAVKGGEYEMRSLTVPVLTLILVKGYASKLKRPCDCETNRASELLLSLALRRN